MSFKDIRRYFLLSHLTYKAKYADSSIGILWIPISNLFLIAVLTLIFNSGEAKLLAYASYITVGYISWGFLSDTLNGGCDVFRARRNDLGSPGTSIANVFVQALIDRVYVFLLNCIALSFLFLPGALFEMERLFVLIVALTSIVTTSFLCSYLTSVFTLYFPDFKRLIGNLTRILFFSSPIFWGFGTVLSGARLYFYTYNPITYFLELMRYSFGGDINMSITVAVETVVLINLVLAVLCFMAFKLQPPYIKNIQ
jgi:ABC-type polysaccharide/polyol phosphate export permease